MPPDGSGSKINEDTLPPEVVEELVEQGHEVTVTAQNTGYGRGQIILRTDNQVYIGGTETRIDGTIATW